MRIAIVEDEKYFADILSEHISNWEKNKFSASELSIKVERFCSGEEFLDRCKADIDNFEIVFLDIKLDGINGMATAKILRELGYKHEIVFTTSNSEFSIEGYDVRALQYLLKPIKYEGVASCLNNIEQKNFFKYSFKGENIKIPFNDILYFESSNHHIKIHTINSLHTPNSIRSSLSELAIMQLPSRFVQCQRSFIVNVSHINKIKGNTILFDNEQKMSVGKNYMTNLLLQFSKVEY